MKGLSKGRYDETLAGEDVKQATSLNTFKRAMIEYISL